MVHRSRWKNDSPVPHARQARWTSSLRLLPGRASSRSRNAPSQVIRGHVPWRLLEASTSCSSSSLTWISAANRPTREYYRQPGRTIMACENLGGVFPQIPKSRGDETQARSRSAQSHRRAPHPPASYRQFHIQADKIGCKHDSSISTAWQRRGSPGVTRCEFGSSYFAQDASAESQQGPGGQWRESLHALSRRLALFRSYVWASYIVYEVGSAKHTTECCVRGRRQAYEPSVTRTSSTGEFSWAGFAFRHSHACTSKQVSTSCCTSR
ncbi:hypothetical protein J3F83DRAFT_545206 [Trichoderma novae-zelandiae]